jgi:hypothetical protein
MLVMLMVGGGFMGTVLTTQLLFSPRTHGENSFITAAFILLNAFVLVSGLLLVQNPRKTLPLKIALVLQIPFFSSPILAYQFSTGTCVAFGLGQPAVSVVFFYNIGSQWYVHLLENVPWRMGVNIVPVILLAVLRRTTRRGDSLPPPPTQMSEN